MFWQGKPLPRDPRGQAGSNGMIPKAGIFCLPPTPGLSLQLRPGRCPFQGLQAREVAEEEGQPPPGGWERNPNPGDPHRHHPLLPGVPPGATGTPNRSTTPGARPPFLVGIAKAKEPKAKRRGQEAAAMPRGPPRVRGSGSGRSSGAAAVLPEVAGCHRAASRRPRRWRREVLEKDVVPRTPTPLLALAEDPSPGFIPAGFGAAQLRPKCFGCVRAPRAGAGRARPRRD